MVLNHPDVLSNPLAFSSSQTLESISFHCIALHATARNDMMAKLSPIHRWCWLLISMSSRCWISGWIPWGRWAQCEMMRTLMGGTRSGEFGIMNFLKSYRWDAQQIGVYRYERHHSCQRRWKHCEIELFMSWKGKIELFSVYTSQH